MGCEAYIKIYDLQLETRPSKCQKFYTTMIFGEIFLRQNVRDFCPHFNRDNLTYSIKHTFTVQFVIKDYTRQLQCIKYEK